jgi:hypothetical protein
MKKLIALIVAVLAAIGAVVTVLFFRRKHHESSSPSWDSAKDTATSWGKAAADEAGTVADKVTSMADGAADVLPT